MGDPVTALLLLALAQSATFADDFETGTFLKSENPAGRWDTRITGVQPGSITLVAVAAHRGSLGLRVTDSLGGSGTERAGYHLRYNLNPPPSTLFIRLWLRVTVSNSLHVHVVDLEGTNYFGSLTLEQPANAVYTEGVLGMYRFTAANVSLTTGQWHLVEMSAQGVGTASASLKLWVDCNRYANEAVGPPGWQTEAMQYFLVGVTSAQERWVGTIDLDDVRSSPAPMASRLALEIAAGPHAVGSCVPVTVSLRDSVDAGFAPAPYGFAAAVQDSDGGGAFFPDPACAAAGQLAFDGGAVSTSGGWRPQTLGAVTLTASHPDFFPGSATATVVEDAGPETGAAPRRLTVGCGCDATPVGGFGALAMWWLALQAARRLVKSGHHEG